jgi:5-methylcytosine-specific restriction endonuclease McrA
MPMRRTLYPSNWDEISTAAKERAQWRCQICGAPHGANIIRDKHDPRRYEIVSNDADRSAEAFALTGNKVVRVVLTTHHAGVAHADGRPGDRHDKSDNRPENLLALCQRCHLLADLDIHVANQAETRRRKRIEQGQLPLLATERTEGATR